MSRLNCPKTIVLFENIPWRMRVSRITVSINYKYLEDPLKVKIYLTYGFIGYSNAYDKYLLLLTIQILTYFRDAAYLDV